MTPAGADRLLLLVAGLAIDGVFGDMPAVFRRVQHPIVLAGRTISFFDRKLNRETRSEASRRYRGIITVIFLVGAAAALGLAIEQLCRGHLLGAVVKALLIAVLVAQRSLYEHVAAVAKALDAGGLAAGRSAVRHIVGRDPISLDAHGVARAAIESLAENFNDGVIAPAFWYLLLGLSGLFAYKMTNTLDSMIGHRSPQYRSFGWAAARFDDLLNLAPAPISGLLLAAAAVFAKNGRPDRALLIMLRHGGGARAGAGWTSTLSRGSRRRSLARRRQRTSRNVRHRARAAPLPARLPD